MSDPIKPDDTPENVQPQPPDVPADRATEEDLREGTVDFNYTIRSNQGGTSTLNLGKVSEPVSGGSIVSWAELLRQHQTGPSEPDVVLGSLPEIQIDAISDNDIVRHLEREGVRVPGRSGLPRPAPSSPGQKAAHVPPPSPSGGFISMPTPLAGTAGSGRNALFAALTDSGTHGALATPTAPATPGSAQSGSLAAKLFAQQPQKEEWIPHVSNIDDSDQSSSIDLRTAAKTAGQALANDSARIRADESDVLAHALMSDDASSAVNLGMEPRVNNLMSTPSLLQKVAAMRAVVPGANPPLASLAPASAKWRTSRHLAAWLGGAAIGVALGTGIAFLAGVFKRPVIQQVVRQQPAPGDVTRPPVATLDLGRKQLELGEPDQALTIFSACEDTSHVLAGRGQARWLAYVRQQRQRKVPLLENDQAVAAARKELQNAHLPEATLWLGLIDESFGHLDQARITYQRGAQDHPDAKKLFQAALARLDALASKPTKVGARKTDPRLGMALSLLLIQEGGSEPDEAGFDYWQAMQLARQRDYTGAREALKRAKATHEERRGAKMRQGLNPLSDPREDIFLHSCDQLLAYWDVQAKLHAGGYDPDTNAPQTISALLDSRKRFDEAFKSVSTRLKTERMEEFAPALDVLFAERRKVEDEFKQAEKALRMAQSDRTNTNASLEQLRKAAADDAKVALAKLETVSAREADARKSLAEFVAARKESEETLNALTAKLRAAKLVGDAPKPKELLTAIEGLMTGDLAARQAEVAQLRGLLSKARLPVQMLDLWPVLLENSAPREAADPALTDADAIIASSTADEQTKAKAIAVKGMALMVREDYAQARVVLEQARNDRNLASDAVWSVRVKKAEAELTDAGAFSGRLRKLLDRGEPATALIATERGLRIFAKDSAPRDWAKLRALRSEALLRLDRLDEAERDAVAALDSGAIAGGSYAAGRIAEKRQQWDKAKEHYRQAFAASPDATEVKPIRLALARVLARPNASAAEVARASTLAEEAIKAGQAEGHLVKARVLYRQKKYTEAIEESMLGLKGIAPPEFADGWEVMVRSHPALARPDVASKVDPELADRYFGGGLRLYYDRHYEEAETAFVTALKYHGKDARYLYFLGLARLPQGKIEAAQEDFRQAVMLERQGFPESRVISEYFERIQGPERQMINRFRR